MPGTFWAITSSVILLELWPAGSSSLQGGTMPTWDMQTMMSASLESFSTAAWATLTGS
ncbi:hypothetical protein D3C78_1700190 [compost metagenome]